MIPASFDYHRPESLAAAVQLLGSLGEEARAVAGGHSLIPMMKLRMAVPEHLVDLRSIAELKGICIEGRAVSIGAMTTQAEVIASDALAQVCPILRETALQIADPQIRNLGTLGGNVANGDPGNDMPASMQVLDAQFEVAGPEGKRKIAARDFYEAAFFTALGEGEIMTAIHFEAPSASHGYAYEKQKRKIGDYATAAAAVILVMEGGRCSQASIGLTNLSDTPLYAQAASEALVGSSLDPAAIDAAVAAAEAIADPVTDSRGPSHFRRKLAGVMLRRAIASAQNRAA
ncbi:MAG: xanthine dehydrogenase family protein subunit M [Rhodospirillales bacterium]|nr:xanthine dehydrogenase family protein subunit M [Rhodospirillales bacterium]